MDDFRYDIGFSFAGPDRDDRVQPIVAKLVERLGRERVYYDSHFRHELHGRAMNAELAKTYVRDCLIVVVCLSKSYLEREWCKTEWRAIRQWSDGLDPSARSSDRLRLAILRFDSTLIERLGLSPKADGYLDVEQQTDEFVAKYLVERVGKVKWARKLGRGLGEVTPPNPPSAFTSGCGAVMLPIAGGTFRMGTPRSWFGSVGDETLHEVRLTRGFHMSSTPVTQAQWDAVMAGHSNPSAFRGPDLPVESVSWHDAKRFCQRLTQMDAGAGLPRSFEYRLPTEAEWEYACRGGSRTKYPWGRLLSAGREHANLYDRAGVQARRLEHRPLPWDSGYAATSPVGRFKPNAFGLFDMIGNVWEWCEDWYGSYDLADLENPRGPRAGTHKVIRGSSWYDDARRTAHAACRRKQRPDDTSRQVGFRIVAE